MTSIHKSHQLYDMGTIIITLNFLLAKDAKLKKGNEFVQVTCQERGELQAQRV